MTLKEALKHVDNLRDNLVSTYEYAILNELEHFIKERGARLHEQDNQLLEQISYCIENRKLKAEIEQLKGKNIRLLENL